METNSNTLHVTGITKSFTQQGRDGWRDSTTLVLDNISFDIPRDKFVVLFGPNGCGKSTLLKILAGIEQADAGYISFDGNSNGSTPITTGLVFQNYHESLFPWYSVLDNIAFPLELRGVATNARRHLAAETLAALGTEVVTTNEYGKYPYQLSGGQQQLVAIARELVEKPALLLFDEAFAALDHDTRHIMQDALLRVWEKERFLVLFVSHSVEEAVYMADIVVVLSPKPTRASEIINIPLPRPRLRRVESTEDFIRLRGRVLQTLEKIV